MRKAWDVQELRDRLEGAIQSLDVDDSTRGEIRAVVVQNVSDGRVAKHLAQTKKSSPESYVLLVATHYSQYAFFINMLKQGDTEAIRVLQPALESSVRTTLLRWGVWFSSDDLREKTHDIVTDVTMELIEKHFHYECAPLAWTYGIVQNMCRHLIRDATKQSTPQTVGIDTAASEEYLTAHGQHLPTPEQEVTQSLDLEQAFEQLTDKRQTFILLYYIMGYDYKSIAEMLGDKPNSLYKLKSDALEQLGKIYR